MTSYNQEIFAITRREEFESRLFYTDKPKVTLASEPIGVNTYYFDKPLNRLHVNKNNTTHGQPVFYIPDLRLGDKIIVEFEYMIKSPLVTDGIIRVSFNEIESDDPTKTPTLKQYYDAVHNSGEYKKATASYMATNDTHPNVLVEVGIPWWKTGEVFMKDIKVTVLRYIPKKDDAFRGCMIRKNAGVFEIRSDFYGNKIGTLSVKDTTTLHLDFKHTFLNRPVAVGSSDSDGNSMKYRPVIGMLTQLDCDIKFVKVDGTFATLDTMEEAVHFSFMFLGSDR